MTTTVSELGVNEMYCKSCGNQIMKEAEICPKCGVRVTNRVNVSPQVPKDKTVAVLLAVFLGFWTWLYTYKKDAWKFWLNLGLTVVTFGLWAFVAWIWAIIDVAVKPTEYYVYFPDSVQ